MFDNKTEIEFEKVATSINIIYVHAYAIPADQRDCLSFDD